MCESPFLSCSDFNSPLFDTSSKRVWLCVFLVVSFTIIHCWNIVLLRFLTVVIFLFWWFCFTSFHQPTHMHTQMIEIQWMRTKWTSQRQRNHRLYQKQMSLVFILLRAKVLSRQNEWSILMVYEPRNLLHICGRYKSFSYLFYFAERQQRIMLPWKWLSMMTTAS